MLKTLFKILPSKKFELGKGLVIRYTLIEIKWLFSIYFHQIKTVEQDRFHTHAFNAFVIILNGSYEDEIKDGIGIDKPTQIKKFNKGNFRYIPRELNHKLLKAEDNTVSLLITGPYSSIWTEETNEGVLRVLTKGRMPLGEIKMN